MVVEEEASVVMEEDDDPEMERGVETVDGGAVGIWKAERWE